MKDINYYSKRVLNNLNLVDFFLRELQCVNIEYSLKDLEPFKLKILDIIENYENKYIPQYKFFDLNCEINSKIKENLSEKSSEIKLIFSLIKEDIIHLEILNLFFIINDLINSINGYLREESSNGFIINVEHIESLDFERFKKDFENLSTPSGKIACSLYFSLLKVKNKILELKSEIKK